MGCSMLYIGGYGLDGTRWLQGWALVGCMAGEELGWCKVVVYGGL